MTTRTIDALIKNPNALQPLKSVDIANLLAYLNSIARDPCADEVEQFTIELDGDMAFVEIVCDEAVAAVLINLQPDRMKATAVELWALARQLGDHIDQVAEVPRRRIFKANFQSELSAGKALQTELAPPIDSLSVIAESVMNAAVNAPALTSGALAYAWGVGFQRGKLKARNGVAK